MKILWFVSTLEDTNFLKKFSKYYENIDVFNINTITWFSLLGFSGKQYFPILRGDADNCHKVRNSFNVLSGRLTVNQASDAYSATLESLKEYFKNNTNSKNEIVFMIPSGRLVHHLAARDFAKELNIKTLYINYSNFPGYTFFDTDGTDCLASIYNNPSKLDKFVLNRTVEDVFQHFTSLKENQIAIPQTSKGKLNRSIKYMAFKFDSCVQKYSKIRGDRIVNKKSIQKISEGVSLLVERLWDSSKELEYCFFPLQVSTDQQVLINYDKGSIFSAIDEAVDYADREGLPLVIKEHPAENQKNDIRAHVNQYLINSNFNVYWSNESAQDLIDNSKLVITINSTVGLESRLKHKKVVFLGRSFYSKASEEQLAKYLICYLVNVDYHSPIFNKDIVGKILNFYE